MRKSVEDDVLPSIARPSISLQRMQIQTTFFLLLLLLLYKASWKGIKGIRLDRGRQGKTNLGNVEK